MFALLGDTLSVTAPVFSMLLLGILLRRLGAIDAAFINTASSLVFNATMPTLLFLGILELDPGEHIQSAPVIYFCLATLLGFWGSWYWATGHCIREDRGVYTQGAFRGNNAIVGLALANSLYGDYGLALGSVLAGAVILVYNSCSVVVLAVYSPAARTSGWAIGRSIARNPLIIGVVSALPFVWLEIRLPDWLLTSGHYFARMTLPLALICIGGSLSLAALQRSSAPALSASLLKMLWLPMLSTLGAIVVGFRGAELGILFLYFASPTAAASFVMAQAVRSNAELAASIIMITTTVSVLTINLGIFLLQFAGLIQG